MSIRLPIFISTNNNDMTNTETNQVAKFQKLEERQMELINMVEAVQTNNNEEFVSAKELKAAKKELENTEKKMMKMEASFTDKQNDEVSYC